MSDLIRRSDAIKALYKYSFVSKGIIEREINAIPSADRPRGEWIVDMLNYKSICSVCGAKETDFIYGTEMWYGLGKSKFCPNCGAKMKGADMEFLP